MKRVLKIAAAVLAAMLVGASATEDRLRTSHAANPTMAGPQHATSQSPPGQEQPPASATNTNTVRAKPDGSSPSPPLTTQTSPNANDPSPAPSHPHISSETPASPPASLSGFDACYVHTDCPAVELLQGVNGNAWYCVDGDYDTCTPDLLGDTDICDPCQISSGCKTATFDEEKWMWLCDD